MRKRRIAVVGATGLAGQQFLTSLAGHPWFEVTALAASARSAGRPYGEALRDADGARRWWVAGAEPAPEFLALPVEDAARLDPGSVDLVFAAVESDAARELEPLYARAVPVVSTAAAFRYEPDVPIGLPGVNMSAHLPLVEEQRRRRGWKGFVLPLPNCTTVGLAISLKPILDRFGIARVLMTSLQGISGAGRSPGVVALDIVDNVIPYIPREEEKVAAETVKILGRLGEGSKAICSPSPWRPSARARLPRRPRRCAPSGGTTQGSAFRARRRIRSSSTTTRSGPSPGSTGTPRGAWRRASGACARSPPSAAASSTWRCPTTPGWGRRRAPCWRPSTSATRAWCRGVPT